MSTALALTLACAVSVALLLAAEWRGSAPAGLITADRPMPRAIASVHVLIIDFLSSAALVECLRW